MKLASPALALIALLAAGEASAQETAQPVNDPFEGMNRTSYKVTDAVDRALVGPLARAYLHVPTPARDGVRNVLANLNEPLNVLNYLLQLKVGKAANGVGRFAFNTTAGIGGLFDHATKIGLKPNVTDFGQTFARYGAGPGPYVYIPFVGPSTVRDSLGATVAIFADPVNMPRYKGKWAVGLTRYAMTGLQTRGDFDDELAELRRTSIDPYASLRSLYLQNRAAQISGGQVNLDALPSFDDVPPDGAPEAAPAPPPTGPAPSPAPPPPAAD